MIQREDILSMEYLKKTEFTGSHEGMRYRLEKVPDEEKKFLLKVTVWPEPFSFFATPEDQKKSAAFDFSEDGVIDSVAWMNDRLFEDKETWDGAAGRWDTYQIK